MLQWALGFLVLAILAALLGYGKFADASAGPARALFYLSLIAFAVTLVLGLLGKWSAAGRQRRPRV